jgi:hypothetical protein
MKKTLKIFIGVLFITTPGIFVFAQTDGSAPPADAGTGSAADTPVSAPAETVAVPRESSPRAVPTASTSPTTAPASAPPATPKTPPQVSVPPPAPTTPEPETVTPSPENSVPMPAPFPYALIALAAALVLAPYGMARMLSQKKTDKKGEEPNNKCDQIKELLERKKSTLEIITGTISLKQALIDFLTKKIEEKKEALKDEITTVVVEAVAGEEGEKIIEKAKEVNETYETLVENLERAKLALEYFTNRRKQVAQDIGKIESAYQTCLLGKSVFEGASGLSRGLELFEAEIHQKLYRYTSGGKDVFSHDAVLARNLVELADAGKWLPAPTLPEGDHRFFLTEKGKAEYEKSLLPLHKKHLPDIVCEEIDFSEISGIAYEDEWQVVSSVKEN